MVKKDRYYAPTVDVQMLASSLADAQRGAIITARILKLGTEKPTARTPIRTDSTRKR